jgi:hypothetical protein
LVSGEGRGHGDLGQKLVDVAGIALVSVGGLPPVLPLLAVVGKDMTRGRGLAIFHWDRLCARNNLAAEKLKGLTVQGILPFLRLCLP